MYESEVLALVMEAKASPGRVLELVERRYGVKVGVELGILEYQPDKWGPAVRVFLPEQVHRAELGDPPELVKSLRLFHGDCLDAIVTTLVSVWLELALEHNRK